MNSNQVIGGADIRSTNQLVATLVPKKILRKVSFRIFLGSVVSCKVSDLRMIGKGLFDLIGTPYESGQLSKWDR